MGFSLQNKALFYRQLSAMVTAALSLDRAVTSAGAATLKQAPALADRIRQGDSMAVAFSRFPNLFSEYEIEMIRSAELSGSLDRSLQILANELERSNTLQKSLMSKLAYPVLVAHMAVFVPSLVILVQSGLPAYLWATLGIIIPVYVVGLLLYVSYTSGVLRAPLDTLMIHTPVLGSALRLLACTRFVRGMGHLVEAGTLPYHAYAVAAKACGSSWLRAHLGAGYRKVGDQGTMSQWMIASQSFTPTVTSLVHSGEETGQFGPMLNKAAELLEQDYVHKVQAVTTVLPVLALLSVGGLVGYRCYGMIQDYLKLLDL